MKTQNSAELTGFDGARAAEYDQGAPRSILGFEALYDCVMAVLAGRPPRQRLLVLGAGTGKDTVLVKRRFPEVEVIAVDPSEPMLEVARAKIRAAELQVEVRCGYLEDFDDLTDLDAVVMIGVLHHVPGPLEQETLLGQLGRRLRPGGLLVFAAHVGPLNQPLRAAAWEQQWREQGAEEEESARRRARLSQLAALDPEALGLWLREAGFSHCERIFSSMFFEAWACLRSAEP